MEPEAGTSTQIRHWLVRLQAGDDSARDELIRHTVQRLETRAHQMLRGFPRLQRWEQTGDVLQNALLRLHRALADVQPTSVEHLLALGATQIRRELLDLARHHFGKEGDAAHHATDGGGQTTGGSPKADAVAGAADGSEPASLEAWTAFHEQAQALPATEKQIVDMLYYQDLSQAEAAGVLGLSVRTVKARWQSARMKLHEALAGQWPEE